MFVALAAAAAAFSFGGRPAVEDHGRLGIWIHSSMGAASLDHDGDGAQRGIPVLETGGDPPSPFRSFFAAPASTVTYGSYTSVQVNVD